MEKKVAILLADLSGYTAMTDVHGGESAAMLVKKYMAIVNRSLVGSTKVIQRVGDQIVLLAENPTDIVSSAQQLIRLIFEEHQFLSIHAGIHYGPVFIEKGNLYGSTINIASRIMSMANQGQILCSSSLLDHVDSKAYRFKHLGHYSFKNVLNEVSVHELIIENQSNHHTDPVCHMQIDPSKTKYTYRYKNVEYHFCSVRCRYIFQGKPESFIQVV